MYIVIKDSVPDYMAPTVAAHASLAGYLKFQDHEDTKEWVAGLFRKVVCRVADETFEKLKKYDDFVIQGEVKLGEEVALVFRPRVEWPKAFTFLPLWKPKIGVES